MHRRSGRSCARCAKAQWDRSMRWRGPQDQPAISAGSGSRRLLAVACPRVREGVHPRLLRLPRRTGGSRARHVSRDARAAIPGAPSRLDASTRFVARASDRGERDPAGRLRRRAHRVEHRGEERREARDAGAGGGNRACRARALGQCADTLRAGGKWAHLLRADGGKSAHRGHLNTGNGACHAGAAGGRSRARRAGARGRSRHAAPRRQGRGGDLDSRTDRRRPRRRGTARGRGQAGVDLGQTLPPDGGQRGWRGGGVQRPGAPLARRPGRRHPTPVASRIPYRLVSFLRSLTDRVRQGLQRTRDLMDDGLDALLAVGRRIDDALLDEIEEALIAADLGADAAAAFVRRVREEARRGRAVSTQDVKALLRSFLEEALSDAASPLALDARPSVVLMLGVNGAGKTTTAGKLAASLKSAGKTVVLAAADTFRAAAIEQLEAWGRRADVDVVRQAPGADPSAVVFDALKAAHARGIDVVLVDTAGRLHTKSNLMDELVKLKRVIGRQIPGAPHECLMVIEAPTGQNGLQQAKMFHEAIGLTGLVVTKLDGTAKGGIVVRIHQELAVPIKLVGVGEQIEDLQPFDPKAFVAALVSDS